MKLKLPETIEEIHDIAFEHELQEAIVQESLSMESRYISLAEFTKRAGVSKYTVQKWIKKGKLKTETINNVTVVRADTLLRMPEVSLDGEWSHQGGTIKTETKTMLKELALAGNISFTIDLGVRLLLGMFGLIPLKYVLPGIALIANRHPVIRETFANQARLLYLFAHEEHNLKPKPEY